MIKSYRSIINALKTHRRSCPSKRQSQRPESWLCRWPARPRAAPLCDATTVFPGPSASCALPRGQPWEHHQGPGRPPCPSTLHPCTPCPAPDTQPHSAPRSGQPHDALRGQSPASWAFAAYLGAGGPAFLQTPEPLTESCSHQRPGGHRSQKQTLLQVSTHGLVCTHVVTRLHHTHTRTHTHIARQQWTPCGTPDGGAGGSPRASHG